MRDVTNELTEHWTTDALPDDHNVGPEYEQVVREPRPWLLWIGAFVLCASFAGWRLWQHYSSAPRKEPQLIMFGVPMEVPAGTRAIECRTYDANGNNTHIDIAGAPVQLGTLAPGENIRIRLR